MNNWNGSAWWWLTEYLPFCVNYAWWWAAQHLLIISAYIIALLCFAGSGWMARIAIRNMLNKRRNRIIDAEIAEENAICAAKAALEKEEYKKETARQIEATASIRETYRAKHRDKEEREEQDRVIRHAQFLRAQRDIASAENKESEKLDNDFDATGKTIKLCDRFPGFRDKTAAEISEVFGCSRSHAYRLKNGETPLTMDLLCSLVDRFCLIQNPMSPIANPIEKSNT